MLFIIWCELFSDSVHSLAWLHLKYTRCFVSTVRYFFVRPRTGRWIRESTFFYDRSRSFYPCDGERHCVLHRGIVIRKTLFKDSSPFPEKDHFSLAILSRGGLSAAFGFGGVRLLISMRRTRFEKLSVNYCTATHMTLCHLRAMTIKKLPFGHVMPVLSCARSSGYK